MTAPTITSITPMGQAFASVGPSSAAQISDAFAGVRVGDSDPLSAAKSAWLTVERIPQKLLDLLDGSRDVGVTNPIAQIKAILENEHLNDTGREQQTQAVIDNLNTQTGALAKQLRTALDAVEQQLRDASLPTRPTGTDAAVRIADSKADLRMIFGALDSPGAMVRRASELLARALTEGDDALAWVLTSPWTVDYQRSRWPDVTERDGGNALTEQLGRVLDQHGGGDVGRAREALAGIGTAATGLRMLLGQLPRVIDGVAREARTAAKATR